MKPIVLTIVPMFNSERFIDLSIDSILAQKNVKVKLVVIDDCSTDNSVKIVEKRREIALLRNSKNLGAYNSINHGLQLAKRDPTWTHYTFHGADDLSHPDRFSIQLGLFSKGVLASGCLFQRKDYFTGKEYPVNPKTNESQLIFSREVFNLIGYYDTNRVGCDTEYKRRLLLAKPGCIKSVSRPLVTAYLHGNNLTKKVPLGGQHRRQYVQDFTKKHSIMSKKGTYYLGFSE